MDRCFKVNRSAKF